MYIPVCERCNACIPSRINTKDFKFSKNNLRVIKFNSDLSFKKNFNNYSQRHYELFKNYFIGERGDKCFVILENEILAKGFLLTVIRQNEVVIDLIAVDKKFRKKGIATKLIEGMISYYKNDYSTYTVGTQVLNVASINLYQKCNFNITEYGLVWHYFNDELK